MLKKITVILSLFIFTSTVLAESKNTDLNIRKFLVKFMKKNYPDPEYINAFDLKNLKSYKTYSTRCGKFYSIEAIDFSDVRAYGYCGTRGCDNFFFQIYAWKIGTHL